MRGLLFGLAVHSAWGAEAVLEPVADTTIYEDDTAAGTGAASFLFVGPLASGSPRRVLLRFDLGALPPGAVVQSVSLRLTVNRNGIGASLDDLHRLQRVLGDWGEGSGDGGSGGGGGAASAADATWTHRFWGSPPASGPRWALDGGDGAPASAVFPLGGVGTYVVASTPGLVADVQGWVDNPSSNHGWLLSGPESPDASQKARRLPARESPSPAGRPLLTVTYAPPVATSEVRQVPLPRLAVLALAVACVGAARRRGARPRRGADPGGEAVPPTLRRPRRTRSRAGAVRVHRGD